MTDDEIDLPTTEYRVEDRTVLYGETFEAGFGATAFHIEDNPHGGGVRVSFLVPTNPLESQKAEFGALTGQYLEDLEDHMEEMAEEAREDRTSDYRYDPDEEE